MNIPDVILPEAAGLFAQVVREYKGPLPVPKKSFVEEQSTNIAYAVVAVIVLSLMIILIIRARRKRRISRKT